MDSNSLAYKTLKNASYSLIAFGWPIIFSIFITPIIVRKLGFAEYGIYILTITIMAFLGLLDLGLSAAVMKYIAEYYPAGKKEELQKVIHASAPLFLLVGIIGFVVYFLLGSYFLSLFHITGGSQGHILTVFSLSGLIFFVNAANSIFTIVPQALQRFDIQTKLNLSQLTLFNFGILFLSLIGFRLKAFFLLQLFSALVFTWFFRVYSKKLLPGYSFNFLVWDFSEIKKLYRFGLLTSVVNLSTSALNQLDRLLIPIFMGPVALSYYSLPGNVAQKTATVAGSLSVIFYPLASSLTAEKDLEQLKQVYRKIIRNINVLAAGIACAIMVFGFKILQYWINENLAINGFRILQILAVTYFILAVYGTLYQFLLGLGRLKFMVFWSITIALLNLGLILFLVPKMGILGAAWAYLAGTLPIVFMFWYAEKKFFGLTDILSFYFKLFLKIAFTGGMFYVFAHFVLLPLVTGLVSLIIIGPISILLFYLFYWLCGFFEKEDVEVFGQFFLKIKQKF